MGCHRVPSCPQYCLTKPLGAVIRRFRVRYHQRSDVTQLYFSLTPESGEAMQAMDQCVDSVVGRMKANKLSLKPGKTEVLWVRGSKVRIIGQLPALDRVILPL